MSTTGKILIFIGMIITIGCLGFVIYNQINISKQQQAIQTQVLEQRALVDGLVQSANQYTTKADLNAFIQQNAGDLKAIQDNLSSLGAQITAANVVTANSQGQSGNNLPSSGTGPVNPKPPTAVVVNCPNGGTVNCPNTDPYGYQSKQQDFALNEDFATLKVPFGTVSFSAWQQNPWSQNILPRTYNVTSVIGTDENQRVYVDNKMTVTSGGKQYTIPITTAKTEQTYPSAKWSFWNPQLFLGADANLSLTKFPAVQGEFVPNLTFGAISYGQFKTTPDVSVLQVGAGYAAITKRPVLTIVPVAFNLHKVIPIIQNTYLAPTIQISTDGTVYGGGGLHLHF